MYLNEIWVIGPFEGPIIILVKDNTGWSVTIKRIYANSSNELITENEWLTIKITYEVNNV